MVSLSICEHKAIGSLSQGQTVFRQGVMQLRPTCRAPNTVETLTLHPANEAFDPSVLFHLDCPTLRSPLLSGVVVRLKSIGCLEFFAQLAERRVVVVRRVNSVARRVNLVDGDVDVQVVCVVMQGTYALVLPKTQALAQTLLDGFQDCCRRLLADAKRHNEVVGLVRA